MMASFVIMFTIDIPNFNEILLEIYMQCIYCCASGIMQYGIWLNAAYPAALWHTLPLAPYWWYSHHHGQFQMV